MVSGGHDKETLLWELSSGRLPFASTEHFLEAELSVRREARLSVGGSNDGGVGAVFVIGR